jgi:hypothetical protein
MLAGSGRLMICSLNDSKQYFSIDGCYSALFALQSVIADFAHRMCAVRSAFGSKGWQRLSACTCNDVYKKSLACPAEFRNSSHSPPHL